MTRVGSAEPTYTGRNRLELFGWAEFHEPFMQLQAVILGPGELDMPLKLQVFTVTSLSAGCRHCQAHGAFGLHMFGAESAEITDLWTFERSARFSPPEVAALRLARDAGLMPNAVGPQHFVQLRRHYSDQQIRELLAVVAIGGFLNRYSDTVAVVTDEVSASWSAENLSSVGWEIGKHAGTADEQRLSGPGDRS
jgi:alkylhydroperoxidase family enzyme